MGNNASRPDVVWMIRGRGRTDVYRSFGFFLDADDAAVAAESVADSEAVAVYRHGGRAETRRKELKMAIDAAKRELSDMDAAVVVQAPAQ